MTALKLYETVAEIDAACVMFHTKGQKLQNEAHRIACSVLKHVGEHGDVRVVAKFLMSFPEFSRVNAIRAWFEEFGPISFDKNQPMFVRGKKTKLGEALETPFYKFKPEAPYQPINPAAALETMIKKLQRDAKETGRDHSVTIAALRLVPVNVPTVETTAPAVLQ